MSCTWTRRASPSISPPPTACTPGTVVSIRRDKIPIVHPVTGEKLGELDEEVATAKVVELRDRFSVAEIQTVGAGSQIEVRDRVVPK